MPKAIVVGASSGIGRELAKILGQNGYEVGLLARREELLLSLQQEITTKTYVRVIDISEAEETIQAFRDLLEEMEEVNVIVINSGVGYTNAELDVIKEIGTIDVNVIGFTVIATEAYKYFSMKGKGQIVGISSIAAFRGNYLAPAYNASKAFMSNYLEGLRKKAFKENKDIIVTDIKPGYVDTALSYGPGRFWVASAWRAADQIYTAIRKKKSHAYITKRWRLIAWLLKFMPEWIYDRT